MWIIDDNKKQGSKTEATEMSLYKRFERCFKLDHIRDKGIKENIASIWFEQQTEGLSAVMEGSLTENVGFTGRKRV